MPGVSSDFLGRHRPVAITVRQVVGECHTVMVPTAPDNLARPNVG